MKRKTNDFEVSNRGFGNKYVKIDPYNVHRFYELRFAPIFPYEKDLNLNPVKKVEILNKLINYLEDRNIHVTFTDRLLINDKEWEVMKGEKYRYLPIAELEGNNICINARNIDFLSILFSVGHIYGHLVQRMTPEKYAQVTDFLDYPKPLDLEQILRDYKQKHDGNYKEDFLLFEIEAFQYAKFAFMQAGLVFDELMDHAMNVYIQADFQELWRWVSNSPIKDEEKFMSVFQKLYKQPIGTYTPIEPKEIEVNVVPAANGILEIVRDEHGWN